MKPLKLIAAVLVVFSLSLLVLSSTALAAETSPGPQIPLTQKEQEFIRDHPVIHLGVDPTFVPYEFIDTDGQYKGIAADYIALICEKTGLQMEVKKGLTWTEAYEMAVQGQLDALPCVGQTAERERYFLFSDTYFSFQRAVFVNADIKDIRSFDDLSGKTIAVQMNSSHHSFMTQFPEVKLSLYPTVEAALRAVSNGIEIAFVGNFATTSYLAKSIGISNLKYIPIEAGADAQSQSLHFAVRKDWPELVSIINKALASITKQQRTEINNKWINVEGAVDYSYVLRVIGIAGLILVAVLAVSYFWIIRLRKEIAKRRKAQEEATLAKEEAVSANQVKSMFLARMSHEIRTPLNAILGMAYLMKKTDLTATQGMYLDKLTQASRNMLGTINDILDFSKIEAGKITIEKVPFDLDKILQRIISIESVKVEEQGIELSVNKNPDVPSMFLGDPLRIEQILLNLINNAVKFTDHGSVKVSISSDAANATNRVVTFIVSDTGIGMSPEQLEHLFIPFDQGDSSISRRFGGSGLGLSIVKCLTDLMDGQISATSEKGQGSAFTVQLPLEVDTVQESAKNARMSSDCFRNTRALILLKTEGTRAQLEEYLRSFGIQNEIVETEQLMRSKLDDVISKTETPYQILIIDHATPQNGGIEFYKKLLAERRVPPESKSILLVPMMREDLFEELESAGIDIGITKPIIPSVLYNGIIEILKIKPPEEKRHLLKGNQRIAPHPYRLLLVEDNKTNQFIAKSILEQAGFVMSITSDGEEGYQYYAAHQSEVDLILMDLHMPVMDGYTASDMIRKINQEIPIVAMTADAITGVEERCRSHGIWNYVSKPFEPDQLIETLIALLSGKRPSAQPIPSDPTEKPATVKTETEKKQVVDFEDGMKCMGGDKDIYRLVLQSFADENSGVGAQLEAAIRAKDYLQGEQIVHKIKSSAGSIGAKSLQDIAVELQHDFKDADDIAISKISIEFFECLQETLTMILKFLKTN